MRLPVALAAVLLAGCLSNGAAINTPPASPHFGLGLELPTEAPPPGPYLEGTDVTTFLAQLERGARTALEACGKPEATQYIVDGIRNSSTPLFAGTMGVYNACQGDLWSGAEAQARKAKQDGREGEVFGEALQRAQASLDNQTRRLDALAPPASVPEVQLQGKLMEQVLWRRAIVAAQPAAFEIYQKSRDEFELANILMSLQGVQTDELAQPALLMGSAGSRICNVPNVQAYESRVADKLAGALELAQKHGTAEESQFVNEVYGRLRLVTSPDIGFAIEHHWWQHLLREEMDLDHHTAYYQTYDDSALPSQSEAVLLVAQYWNTTRSLATDDRLQSLADQMQLPNPWGTDLLRPRLAAALSEMEWSYSQVECVG